MGVLPAAALGPLWQRGAIASVYLFAGEEITLKEEALRRLEDLLFTEETRPFNREVVSGASINVANLVQAGDTLPLVSSTEPGAAKRLIVIRAAQRIPATQQAEMALHLHTLPKTSCLVFLWEGPWRREELKRPLIQGIQQAGEVVEFWPLARPEAVQWMITMAQQRGKRLLPEAAEEIYEMTEGTLQELRQAVEQLCWFVGSRSEMTMQDIAREGGARSADPFRWAEALQRRDLPTSLKLLEQLLQEGEEPVRLLHLAARSIIRELPRMGAGVRSASQTLETWRRLTHVVQRADVALKTGQDTPVGVLTRLTVQVCQSGGPSSVRQPSSE